MVPEPQSFARAATYWIGQYPVMGMLDRNFESSVTGSEMWSCTWSNKRIKSCYRARARLHTDQDDLWRGQPVIVSFSVFALQKQHFYQNIVTAPRDGHTPRSQALCAF